MARPRTRRHRIMGGISVVAIMLFIGGTGWAYLHRPAGALPPGDLPACDDDRIVASVKSESPFVTWAKGGTEPITALRDIRAGAWNADRRLQYCSATAITETGSYTITYGLSRQGNSDTSKWSVQFFPDSPRGM